MSYNIFSNMPYIPYNIISYLAQSSNGDNIFKILYYNTYDCLSKPNLTLSQKMGMIWKNNDNQEDYNIYLTYLVGDMQLESKTILKLYQYKNAPIHKNLATLTYAFDILMGQKIAMIDYNGIPVNRIEALEYEILKCLNGKDIGGSGYIQFNQDLDGGGLDSARFNIGNNSTFTGVSLLMSVQISGVSDNAECS